MQFSLLYHFFSNAGYVYMNGDIGKSTAVGNTAIYTSNQIDTTSGGIMGAPVGMTAVAIVPVQTQTNPAPPQNTEYALVNGNMMQTVNEMQTNVVGEYYSASDQSGGETTAGSSGTSGQVNENGIPMDQLKQMLSAQLEYYFSR